MCIYINRYAYMYMYTKTHVHSRMRRHACFRTHTYIHTYIHTFTHSCTHAACEHAAPIPVGMSQGPHGHSMANRRTHRGALPFEERRTRDPYVATAWQQPVGQRTWYRTSTENPAWEASRAPNVPRHPAAGRYVPYIAGAYITVISRTRE